MKVTHCRPSTLEPTHFHSVALQIPYPTSWDIALFVCCRYHVLMCSYCVQPCASYCDTCRIVWTSAWFKVLIVTAFVTALLITALHPLSCTTLLLHTHIIQHYDIAIIHAICMFVSLCVQVLQLVVLVHSLALQQRYLSSEWPLMEGTYTLLPVSHHTQWDLSYYTLDVWTLHSQHSTHSPMLICVSVW